MEAFRNYHIQEDDEVFGNNDRVSVIQLKSKCEYIFKIFLHLRTTSIFIDKSIAELEVKASQNALGDESVLEKLLKIDKRVAIIMALDMLMAGVDTV